MTNIPYVGQVDLEVRVYVDTSLQCLLLHLSAFDIFQQPPANIAHLKQQQQQREYHHISATY